MIDTSTPREDELNHQVDVTSDAATPLDSADAAVSATDVADAQVSEPVAPLSEHATIIVPPAEEANLSSIPLDTVQATDAAELPLASPPLDAAQVTDVAEPPTATESGLAGESEPSVESVPVAELAPIAATDSPVADDASMALPVRPAPRLPLGDRAGEEAPVEAMELVPEGGEETPQLSRRGRIELLPNEEIVYHLSALYLTNKRVLLYAPTVLRAAFLRDVDAMGMATERLPAGVFILGLVMMVVAALTGGLIYFDANQELSLDSPLKGALTGVRNFLPLPLEWVAVGIALLGLFFIISYFFYISKSLFVSVHGRPLITVSISGYRPRNLEDIDNFINALAGAKDALDGGAEDISLATEPQ